MHACYIHAQNKFIQIPLWDDVLDANRSIQTLIPNRYICCHNVITEETLGSN